PRTERSDGRGSREADRGRPPVRARRLPSVHPAVRQDRDGRAVGRLRASARDYRRQNKIRDDLGTAVNIVAMVFGNRGEDSGTGVAFTRDPSTGEKVP